MVLKIVKGNKKKKRFVNHVPFKKFYLLLRNRNSISTILYLTAFEINL